MLEQKQPEQKPIKKTNYYCEHCKYQFSRRVDFVMKNCPFCGRDSIVERKSFSADKLLQEVKSFD